MSFKSILSSILFVAFCIISTAALAEEELTPNEVLDNYFKALSEKSVDQLLTVFAENAVVVTAAGEHHGHDAIVGFYRRSMFHCEKFKPHPGKRFVLENQIAVEMYLDCDGDLSKVGDFFTFKNGKLARLVVYSGPGYFPVKPPSYTLPILRP